MTQQNSQITTGAPGADAMERALILQDLAGMNSEQRLHYYKAVCDSLGINALTRPFAYISLNGKLTLYALKDCTDQLRKIHDVSIEIVSREEMDGVYVVTARATNKSGRKDESIGAVAFENVKGEARANLLMKCETKSKRRVTLSFCGLGMLDETEINDEVASGGAQATSAEHVTVVSGEPIYDWRNVHVHFGQKHGPGCKDTDGTEHPNGRQLGELSDSALQWFQTKWEPRPDSAADMRLRRALDISLGKAEPDKKPETEEPKMLRSAEITGDNTAAPDAGVPD